MGTHAYANGPTAAPLQPGLEALVRNLDHDSVRSKRLIRQLMENDGPEFLRGAVAALRNGAESRGAQYLLELVTQNGLLLGVLCHPGLSRENALDLARAAIRTAPKIDISLARGLAEMVECMDGPAQLENATRLMEILAEISYAGRVFPSLVRLLRHPNPHLRSKAVLMIGRGSRSAQWVRHRLGDTDPRIRANALEALWDVNTDEARQLLEALVRDPNNRVAGNAMVGLYRLGQASVIPEILALANHESAPFRSTAAWVMGETGDPRFTEILAGMLREPNATIRKRAFAALGGIRTAVARTMQSPSCRVTAYFVGAPPGPESQKPMRRLVLGVAGQAAYPAPDLLPTQVLLSEDGRMVPQYRVNEKPLPETISVVFLMPATEAREAPPEIWRKAALGCLPWKRPSDLWACDFYESDAAREAGAENRPPRFQLSPESLHSEFARSPLRFECPDLWRGIRRLVDVEDGPLPGKRHLIVFKQDKTFGEPSEELVAAIAAAHAMVQVISCGPDPILEDFCRKVNGMFWEIERPEQAEAAALHAYLHQLTHYEVAYQPVNPEAKKLKIRLHGASLWGEATIPIPGAP